MERLTLSERWLGCDDASPQTELRRSEVHAELPREVGPTHPLTGRIERVEAFFEATDDVIVRLSDDTFALVHPTWRGKVEPTPWPSTTFLGGTRGASERLQEFELLH